MFERLDCPVCGFRGAEDFDMDAAYLNRRCGGCGSVYLARKKETRPAGQLYDEKYYRSPGHQFGYEDYTALREAIHRSADKRFKRIERLSGFTPGRSVLDVGCACGYYLEKARERGWDVQGIDISKWAIEQAPPDIRPKLLCDDLLTTTKLPKERYDCATLWDIIEQTPEPRRILTRVRDLLKPGGWLVLMFRDIGSPTARLFGRKWIHYRPEEKYVYLTMQGVRQMLAESGFGVRAIERSGTGKDTPLAALAEKLENYSRPLGRALKASAAKLGLSEKLVCVNFMDTRIAYATKL